MNFHGSRGQLGLQGSLSSLWSAQSRVSHGFSPGCSGLDPARSWNASRLEAAMGRSCSPDSVGESFSVFPVQTACFGFCPCLLSPCCAPLGRDCLCLPTGRGAAAGSPQSHPFSSLEEPQSLSLSSKILLNAAHPGTCIVTLIKVLFCPGDEEVGVGCSGPDSTSQVLSVKDPLSTFLPFCSCPFLLHTFSFKSHFTWTRREFLLLILWKIFTSSKVHFHSTD